MGNAASLYAMMRNTGSAIGISLVTNMLNSHQQMHQAYLGQHVTIFDAWKLDQAGSQMPGAPPMHLINGMIDPSGPGIWVDLRQRPAPGRAHDL